MGSLKIKTHPLVVIPSHWIRYLPYIIYAFFIRPSLWLIVLIVYMVNTMKLNTYLKTACTSKISEHFCNLFLLLRSILQYWTKIHNHAVQWYAFLNFRHLSLAELFLSIMHSLNKILDVIWYLYLTTTILDKLAATNLSICREKLKDTFTAIPG